ncbi:DUF4123 domain-containing protein [Halomonas sp. LR3S48]|uniref:DUF4123 domain-containing protein n=1 Tax=Halomonas sp. LR3S48 TaxID=2982694 RepID=UPI0021E438C0|nr:DUF4123 domain-containing protein [Halomonas sp. LR3S48]UYG04037.1 DUF4123 domain-containing protein [Halomonas sp. LR3S48]
MRYAQSLPERTDRRYWLVDTANLPEGEVLRRVYETMTQPDFLLLYEGTPYHEIRDSGPVLLDITEDDSCWQQCRSEWVGCAASVIIDTRETLENLHERLAASLTIETSGGGKGLLRFHESAALHLLLGEGLLDPADRLALVGESACWSWPLCHSEGSIIHEHYYEPHSGTLVAGKALRLDVVAQQQLQDLRQFSRLMPVLGDTIHRFDLLQREETITTLWQALKRYWHATWQDSLPRKQAMADVQRMLVRSEAIDQFIGELGAYSQDAFTSRR